jgi:hypothetical protein
LSTLFDRDELFASEEVFDDFGDEVDEGFEEELLLLVFGAAALVVHEEDACVDVALSQQTKLPVPSPSASG